MGSPGRAPRSNSVGRQDGCEPYGLARLRVGPVTDRARPAMRVGFFIDGGEAYGVRQSMRLLLTNLDPRCVTTVGVFVGRGPTFEALGPLCTERALLMRTCLIPLSDPSKSRRNPMVFARKLVMCAVTVIRLAAAIRKLRIEVVHANYYPHHFLAGLACRVARCPCVWHWRGPFVKEGRAMHLAEWGMRNLADVILCISDFVKRTLPCSVQRKALVLYNGVDTCGIANLQEHGALRRMLGIGPQQKIVGIFGEILPRKGHELFIRAAASVARKRSDVSFVIVGDESQANRARVGLTRKLQETVSESGLEQQILFTGYLPDAWRYMSDCDVVCMPTVSLGGDPGEGFGLVMAEAMAAGVPVVATSSGAPPEVIEDGTSGLLVPPVADALADATTRLLTDEGFRRRIAAAGQERIREHFDIRYTVEGMQRVYRSLAVAAQRWDSPAKPSSTTKG